jgi:hypothetical protein
MQKIGHIQLYGLLTVMGAAAFMTLRPPYSIEMIIGTALSCAFQAAVLLPVLLMKKEHTNIAAVNMLYAVFFLFWNAFAVSKLIASGSAVLPSGGSGGTVVMLGLAALYGAFLGINAISRASVGVTALVFFAFLLLIPAAVLNADSVNFVFYDRQMSIFEYAFEDFSSNAWIAAIPVLLRVTDGQKKKAVCLALLTRAVLAIGVIGLGIAVMGNMSAVSVFPFFESVRLMQLFRSVRIDALYSIVLIMLYGVNTAAFACECDRLVLETFPKSKHITAGFLLLSLSLAVIIGIKDYDLRYASAASAVFLTVVIPLFAAFRSKKKSLALALPLLLFLTGCDISEEVRSRAFVNAIAVGGAEETWVSVKFHENPDTKSEKSEEDGLIYSAAGSCLSEAVINAQSKGGRIFFTGHTELIVLSGKNSIDPDEEPRKANPEKPENPDSEKDSRAAVGASGTAAVPKNSMGLMNKLRELLADRKISPSCNIIYTDEDAQELLSKEYVLENMKIREGSGFITLNTISGAYENLLDGFAAVPVYSGGEVGMGIIDGSGLVCKLTEKQAKGLAWLKGTVESAVFKTDSPSGSREIRVTDAKTSMFGQHENGGMSAVFRISFTAVPLNFNTYGAGRPEDYLPGVRKEIEDMCASACDKIINECGADVLNLGKAVKHTDYQYYLKHQNSIPKDIGIRFLFAGV